MTKEALMEEAKKARLQAYAPYSGFRVGAALLCEDGAVYTGCNIENSAFSPTLCAERTAFAKAISDGKREFTAIAICGGKEDACAPCSPCGVCRQVMSEFCSPDFVVYLVDAGGEISSAALSSLLPQSFRF